MPADKRIAVSEPTWKELGKMKEAGQTYDDLIKKLIRKANRAKLAQKAREVEDMNEKKLIPLNQLDE